MQTVEMLNDDETKELETMPKGDRWGARMGAFMELVEHHIQDANGMLKWYLTSHKSSVETAAKTPSRHPLTVWR